VKICGIVGSPKKKGNVDLLVSQVLKGASCLGFETKKIYLNDLQIKPCQSCGVDPYPRYCLFDDGMKEIYAVLQDFDAVVLGSPVYFDTVSAQTKLMIDRCNCLMPFVKKPDGTFGFERRMRKRKKGVFVAVSGVDQEFGTIRATIDGFFLWANVELVEAILHSHEDTECGGVEGDHEKMKQAFDAGIHLAQSLKEKS